MDFEWDPKKAARNLAKHMDDNADVVDNLRPEYDVALLKKGVRGKYLARYRAGTNLELLAPEVRAAFPTDESVNQALKSLIVGQSHA